MKKNILVLALSIVSLGAFAQGLGDLKNAAKDAEKTGKDAATSVTEEKVGEVTGGKVDELKDKAAEAVNVDGSTIDAVTEVATDAAKNIGEEKAAKIKEAAEAKLADMKAKREAKLAEKSNDPEKLTEYTEELKAETAEKEALKAEKKAALIAKITSLGSKIADAESKLSLLKESGLAPEALVEKTAIIDNAKAKLASLTSAFN